jgi:hypothetical protein
MAPPRSGIERLWFGEWSNETMNTGKWALDTRNVGGGRWESINHAIKKRINLTTPFVHHSFHIASGSKK